jgi:hypothetical protein
MAPWTLWQRLAIATVVLASVAAAPASSVPASDWAKAHIGGKYKVLLRQIKVPEDRDKHTAFDDVGFRNTTELKGHRDLPPGHWVYVHPYWYIWRDAAAPGMPKPQYHADQATGPPDTPGPGDNGLAWASETPDSQAEWLELEFAEAVVPSTLKVYENFSPGAITKVTVYSLDGTEETGWQGTDPTPSHQPMGISVLPIRVTYPIARVRIHLNSPAVYGWNEIDAVGLADSKGKTQWAVAASASTTFGQPNAMANQARYQAAQAAAGGNVAYSPAVVVNSQPRVAQILADLRLEIRETRKQYDELKQQLETSRAEIKALKSELDALKQKQLKAAP